MSGYFLSAAADLDVDGMYEFGLGEWGERQADRYIHRLFESFGWIAQAPGMGRRRPELHAALRSLPHDSHVIIYMPLGPEVAIVRVLHGAADLRRVFRAFDPVVALQRN